MSYTYGIRELFWFGRSSCDGHSKGDVTGGDFYCSETQWITKKGWEQLLRQFVTASARDLGAETLMSVLWLFIPNYENHGEIMNI